MTTVQASLSLYRIMANDFCRRAVKPDRITKAQLMASPLASDYNRYRLAAAALVSASVHALALVITIAISHSSSSVRKGFPENRLFYVTLVSSSNGKAPEPHSFNPTQKSSTLSASTARRLRNRSRLPVRHRRKKLENESMPDEFARSTVTAAIETKARRESGTALRTGQRDPERAPNGASKVSNSVLDSAPLVAEQVEHPPIPVSQPAPDYPELARLRGIQGEVVLRIVVDTRGDVERNIQVVQSIPLLDPAAVEAVSRWRFTPGRDSQGRLVRVLLEVPLRFTLRPAEGEAWQD